MNLLLLEELEKDNSITLGRGNIISKEEMQQCPGDFPVYSSSATKNGEFGRYGKYMFEDERITWSIDGGGRLFYRNNHKYSVTNVCGWLKVNNPNFSTKFIYYCLFFQWSHLKFDYTYKAHPSVIRKMYKIPVIDLSTQLKIVDELDKINQNIEKETNAFEYYEELIKSRFIEMFGDINQFAKWKNCLIGDIANVSVGVVIEPSKYYSYTGVPAFRSLNIGEMKINNKDWVYFSKEGNEKNRKSIVKENDVLIVRSGSPGKSCVVTKEYDGYNAIDIIIARPNTNLVNPIFLAMFTNMPHGMMQINQGTVGVAQQHFNIGRYKNMKFILPPIELQNEFAEFVKLTDKLKFDDYSRYFL